MTSVKCPVCHGCDRERPNEMMMSILTIFTSIKQNQTSGDDELGVMFSKRRGIRMSYTHNNDDQYLFVFKNLK